MLVKQVGRKAAVAVSAIASAAFVLGASASTALAQEIQIDGSSTVFPVAEAMAEEFMFENSGVNVTVGVSGTGGGFEKFCNGETDISNASRPIKEEEAALCETNGIEFTRVQVGIDALTVVIHPENDWATEMTVEQLRMMWAPEAQGTITSWNQIDPSWPATDIVLYGPGTDSGTFDYFTEEIVGEGGASRADFTASEDDNVLVLGVLDDPNAIAYFGYAYYVENQERLTSVAIDSGDGPIPPTLDNVLSGAYTPLARPLYIYVSNASLERPEVADFIRFYLTNPDLVSEVGYFELPSEDYAQQLSDLGL